MASELMMTTAAALEPRLHAIPPVPWRDPHEVSPAALAEYLRTLEAACLENPRSADLRTCLGIAYAMNYDVYKSMDALELAVSLEPTHFWAQLKYSELLYRLRVLPRAAAETRKAVELARNPWELSMARAQLQHIRRLDRGSTRNITWDKPLTAPALVLSTLLLLTFVVMMWT